MDFIKKNWKNILIVLLSIFFIVECTGKGNYKRRYKNEVKNVEYILDSTGTCSNGSTKYIDSLNTVIMLKDSKIENLENQLSIYKEQNDILSKKKIEIVIPNNESEDIK